VFMNEDEEPVKFGWTTAWWVDRESRHRALATIILFAAMEKCSNRIAGCNPSKESERVWAATKRFRECVRFDRLRFILAPPPSFRVISPLTRWFAGRKNRMIFNPRLQRRGLELRTVGAFDAALESFVNTRALKDPLARDSSYWNWVLNFPWMSANPEDETAQKRYAFSVFAKDFQQISMLVSRRGRVIAFLVLTLREGRLSLKYADYELCDALDVATALQVTVAEINPWLFVSADSVLSAALKRLMPFYLARHTNTSAIYAAKGLPLSLGSHPHWGTGDKLFT